MPLVRLEVENFKSYRGKQTIGPFHTFSAVIGPNGSGKSNLMDAISFVLGVKSAQLRSSQLKDLIYRRGSATDGDSEEEDDEEEDEDAEGNRGKSEGSATRASVTAVYQDSEEREYYFKRTVTSAGVSEYRLNNRLVQATAYNEQLKKFNILVKAKNFLVFQGDVESIASQSPKELSHLVDQISGSLEYKEAYETAKVTQERALEAQKYTLFKRKGMNTELNFFKGQKNEAERFKKLQLDRDSHVQHQVLWTLFHQQKRIGEISKELEKSSTKAPELKKRLNDAEKNHSKRRKELGRVAAKTIDQKKAIRSKEKELENQQPALDAIEEKIKITKEKIANSENIFKSLEPEVKKSKAAIEGYEANLVDAKTRLSQAIEEQASASAAQGLSLSDEDLVRYHELKAEANVRAAAERQKLETISRVVKTKRSTLQTLQTKLLDAENKKEKLTLEEADLIDLKNRLEEKRTATQQSLSDLRSSIEAAERRKREIRDKELELNTTLKNCLDQLREATHHKREMESERKKKETIHALQRNHSGVHGRLADLCRPTQRKYDLAISTILGRNADAIVVETQKDATDCIHFLKQTRSFQATFIPLDSIQVKDINDRLRSIDSGARLAFDVIQFEAKLERAMQYACGNALVCDSMSIARTICYEKKQEVKAVTLEGTVIHKSGLISGGQNGDSSTKRWEDREVEGLERQRDDCLSQLRDLGKERNEVNRQEQLTIQVSRLEADFASLNDDLSKVDQQLKGAQDEIKVLEKYITELSPRIATAQSELDTSLTQTTDLKLIVDAEDDAVFADFCRRINVGNIREYEERQLKLMQQQSDARMDYERQVQRVEHTLQWERVKFKEIESRFDYLQQFIEKRNQDLIGLRSERRELRKALDEIVGEIDKLKEEWKELQATETEASAALAEERTAVRQAQSALDDQAKEAALAQLEMETLGADRLKLYRRCRLEEIALPLLPSSKKLEDVPLEKKLTSSDSEDEGAAVDESMDLDDYEQSQGDPSNLQVLDYGIKVNFSNLSAAEKKDGSDEMARELKDRIEMAASELEKMSPNIKAGDRLADTETRLGEVDKDFEKARDAAKRAQEEFLELKKKRCALFNKAFEHVRSKIDSVYKELTKSKTSPKGGSAYLVLENEEEPYLAGLQFSAIPPAKTFRGIDHLSGGEKTMAAIALLFAVQSVYPAPFIVLDEVDAALDSTNVQRVANYIRSRASKELQFIVISHKAALYERSSALVGVLRNQQISSSATLTLDLEQYA